MPTLIRFLFFCGLIVGIAYGAMFALIFYVEPKPREITVRVPTERLNPAQQPAAPASASSATPASPQPAAPAAPAN